MKYIVAAAVVIAASPTVADVSISISLPADAEINSHAYSCGGEPFNVSYISAGENRLAILTVDGEERIFVNVISGSGARYASGEYIWWSKGDTATLENEMGGASPLDCTTAK